VRSNRERPPFPVGGGKKTKKMGWVRTGAEGLDSAAGGCNYSDVRRKYIEFLKKGWVQPISEKE